MNDQKDERKVDILWRNQIYPDAEGIFSFKPKLINEVKNDCIVIPDTNSLLVPFTTGKQSLGQIEQIYKQLVENKRLFIPAQVAREFAEHRVTKLKELYQQIANKKAKSLSLGIYPLLKGLPNYKEAVDLEPQINNVIQNYNKAIENMLAKIRDWYWNDPVSDMYNTLFSKNVVFDFKIEETNLRERLNKNSEYKLPPGYKDSNKLDDGVGDLIIWLSILEVAKKEKKDLIFVSLDQKADWWSQSEGRHLYPRYELIDEYRRASGGKSLHLLTFSEFLELFGASKEVVDEVRKEENQVLSEDIDIISLAIRVEKALRKFLASSGLLNQAQNFFLKDIKLAESYGFKKTQEVQYFWKVRNKIAHGLDVREEDITLAVEAGLAVLSNIQE
ncbi:hypothetical protein BH24ACI2_BH24ACI2_05230 [soil metagenome]